MNRFANNALFFATRLTDLVQKPGVLKAIDWIAKAADNPLLDGILPAPLQPFVGEFRAGLHIVQNAEPEILKDLVEAAEWLHALELPSLPAA